MTISHSFRAFRSIFAPPWTSRHFYTSGQIEVLNIERSQRPIRDAGLRPGHNATFIVCLSPALETALIVALLVGEMPIQTGVFFWQNT